MIFRRTDFLSISIITFKMPLRWILLKSVNTVDAKYPAAPSPSLAAAVRSAHGIAATPR
jgi:hypothetical protein